MAEAGKLFERFARVEERGYDVELLKAEGGHPAFVVEANLLTDHQLNALRDRHMKVPKRQRRGQFNQKELDEKSYWPVWVKRVIINWRGLTKGNLGRLVVGLVWENEAAFNELFPTGEVPFSYEFAMELHEQSQNTFTGMLALELNEIRESLTEVEEEDRDYAKENLSNGFASSSASEITETSPNGAPESIAPEIDSDLVKPSSAPGS